MLRSRSVRLFAAVTLSVALASGCAEWEGPRMRTAEAPAFTAAGIDEANGGIRVTTYQAERPGQVQLLQEPSYRSQTFTSLQDAAWPWERKQAPDWIVIGQAWVERHGFSSVWASQLHRIGVNRGRAPQVAVVGGTAEQYLNRRETADLGFQSVQQLGLADYTTWSVDGRISHEADVVLPFLEQSSSGQGVSVQALVFKKQQRVGLLTPSETQLLACLQGARKLPELTLPSHPGKLESVSCQSTISSNGDLQQPKLRIRLHITSSGQEVPVQALRQEVQHLLGWLQDKQADPLRLGDSMRRQHRGYWSDERWREVYAKAPIEVEVATTYQGGIGK
ncbi:Ger(x)C family spore germination C-terminal domain-containing protein [Paenibacillus silviterrae]|uniref:Ger(x)C family spore germination C-terminal domain-containing protein n=1 Tax=Paenibacillus silviterrae TaxID=3242194 RepID=UPI002542E9F6|nr:Ger(x)C family spore germination C-terminal domain-containing protein [Paenibacillus chinjuensis]